ncbi:succinate dehydrogenase, hydrophobic membrane anchor protein [Luteimonas sp. S4-F44]|uniref:succinate dehydrogenase, hydrophobic membrane anchor protein n=1 Tax=Luteimonas sp. S4-F44 TaxID=2925842 RepID=UPI001F536630|nr:succinate dehydrogenase, hydrophobic membrane anchor protein [Luteimonas sp. S4-F44]UNK41114.1 succinate dehydrogenase, hydrophobic membrane anchor protein [Luteimonas sp. S4-F44]
MSGGGGETSRAVPLRTPVKRAQGLGSGKSGTTHFWKQRVTAIILVPLVVWFVLTLLSLVGAELETARAIIARPWNAILFSIFLVTLFWHAKLGLQVVIEDYVHKRSIELALQLLVTFLCGLGAIASLYAIARIAFTA